MNILKISDDFHVFKIDLVGFMSFYVKFLCLGILSIVQQFDFMTYEI